MSDKNDWAVITPLANEEATFPEFAAAVQDVMNQLNGGVIYTVIDKASKDRTLEMAQAMSQSDPRFITVWAPENRNVVDAYLRGLREACQKGHEYIIEMDGGLSHDPAAIPAFLKALQDGNECVFGSRFVEGGSMSESPLKRKLLSKFGTILANGLLGTKMDDMTSGFEGFRRDTLEKLLRYQLLSTAHFYQTEVRYLLRKHRYIELPIHYRAASDSVSKKALKNALTTLWYYTARRLTWRADSV